LQEERQQTEQLQLAGVMLWFFQGAAAEAADQRWQLLQGLKLCLCNAGSAAVQTAGVLVTLTFEVVCKAENAWTASSVANFAHSGFTARSLARASALALFSNPLKGIYPLLLLLLLLSSTCRR
jgi:hypothetical protein